MQERNGQGPLRSSSGGLQDRRDRGLEVVTERVRDGTERGGPAYRPVEPGSVKRFHLRLDAKRAIRGPKGAVDCVENAASFYTTLMGRDPTPAANALSLVVRSRSRCDGVSRP
jgi:hypothetical protein